jgi:hypothetical protein
LWATLGVKGSQVQIHRRAGTGALTLFLDRAALVTLHDLTGSALAELTDSPAADTASTDKATAAEASAGFPGGGVGPGHHHEEGSVVVAVERVDSGHGLGGEVVGDAQPGAPGQPDDSGRGQIGPEGVLGRGFRGPAA